MKLERQPP